MATATLTAAPVTRLRAAWVLAAAVVALQVAYPLLHGGARDAVTVATVLCFFSAALTHAVVTRGGGYATRLVLVAAGGGFVAEAAGVRFGVPFGSYSYAGSLGPRLLDVPVVVPLAWAMMAHPAVCVAARLTPSRPARVAVAAWALAGWDLFLDPQMVAAGHWRWAGVGAHLPGVPDVPLTNYAGWLAVALVMAALLVRRDERPRADGPPLALYLWTWAGSVLANVAFFGRPAVALWGGLAMGLVAVPLARELRRPRWH